MRLENLSIEEIKEILPHRYPFLFLDRVLEVRPDECCRAIKNVSGNESFFEGHFPDKPVVPGVIMVEALAQAAGVLIYFQGPRQGPREVFLAGINNARFYAPVVPGDQLVLESTLKRHRLDLWIFEGVAFVNEEAVARAELKIVVR